MSETSLTQSVVDRCRTLRFTGVLRIRAKQGEGELWFVSGITDESRFGVSTGDEAMDRILRATEPKIELVPRLPDPSGSSKKSHPMAGQLGGGTRPVDLFNYCESNSLTCTIKLTSKGRSGEATYKLGELVDVRTGEGTDRAVAEMLEWGEGTFQFVLPVLEMPEGVTVVEPEAGNLSVAPPAVAPVAAADAGAIRKKVEEVASKVRAEPAPAAADEAKKKAAAEAEATKKAAEDEAATKKAAEEAARKKAEDAEARKKADEEARRRAEEARKKAEEIRRKTEETRKKAEEEAARKKAAEEKAAAEKAAAEKAAAEKAAAEKAAAEKAAAEKAAAEKAAAEKAAAEKAAAEKAAAEKAAAEKAAAEAAEKVAAEKAAKAEKPAQHAEKAAAEADADEDEPKKKTAKATTKEERALAKADDAREPFPSAPIEAPPTKKSPVGMIVVIVVLLAVVAYFVFRAR